jgi:nucleosome assembly protein 1-like 1
MAPSNKSPDKTTAADPVDEPEAPIVSELKTLDDKYLALEREYEKEVNALKAKYTDLQKPILEERCKKLTEGEEKTGTPACKGFWRQALQNHPALEGDIENYDEPVLDYLKDIQVSDLDVTDSNKGFRIRFIFAENPYFENAVLSKEYHTKESSPYTQEIEVEEINGCTIKWKSGKDVTVETAKKAKKGAAGKKKKQTSGSTTEPRPSFFRSFFRTYKVDGDLPDDMDPMEVVMEMGADPDELDPEEILQMAMENDHETGGAIRDQIVPFAVRWYTGEAAPDRDHDSDEGDESEEDDESDEDEDDSPKDKKKKGGKAGKMEPADAGKEKEECKQQ